MNKVSKLVGLAQAEIGSLTNEEKILLEKSEQGERVDYSGKKKQSIRAELIEWLCRDSQAMSLVSHHGIKIKGVRINKVLDLRLAEITVPLIFEESSLPKGINLENSKICLLDLSGSQTGSINLANSKVKNGVFMRGGFQAKGLICLDGAKIGRVLDCTGSKFINPGKCCLEANGVKVTGSVLLHNGFKVEGMVGLVGTTIEGNLECNQGVFLNKGKVAINGNGLKVHGDVFLCDGFWGEGEDVHAEGFRAEGEVKLVRAEIDGSLECKGGQFINPRKPEERISEPALQAREMEVSGNVLLHYNFRAEGMVNLVGARIGGNLECNQGEFINEGGVALNADRIEVHGDVFLCDGCWHEGIEVRVERFKAEGEVKLVGAVIDGSLECRGGHFINPRKPEERISEPALQAREMEVSGSVLLREGFMSMGKVNLVGATIGGDLKCHKGSFLNGKKDIPASERIALLANGLKVKGNVELIEKCKFDGEVSLVGARVQGFFYWMDVDLLKGTKLDLRSAKIGILRDHKESWPEGGNLFIHGMVYEEIHNQAPMDADSRIDWIRRQYDNRAEEDRTQFWPQPYEQLAAVLRDSGHERTAKKILIAKNTDRRRYGSMGFFEKCWHFLLGCFLGYGYKPSRGFLWILGFVILGAILFGIGRSNNLITETRKMEYTFSGGDENQRKDCEVSVDYPKFQAVMYSLDVFVPLIDLKQAKYWLPNSKLGEVYKFGRVEMSRGGLLLGYMWFHIIIGWVLTSLSIVGLTGLVRR